MAERQDKRLDSWKEISAYLGRDLRTVVRWEKDKGLPVHRVPGGKRHAVFAYTEEIDAWLGGGPAAPDAPAPQGALGVNAPLIELRGSRVHIRVALLAVTAGLLLVAVAYRPWIGGQRQVARVSFSGNAVVAWDEAGKFVWSSQFPETLPEASRTELLRRSYIGNLDGSDEAVLVSVPFVLSAATSRDELYCFSRAGKVRWRAAFTDSLTFGADRYGPPWRWTALHVYRALDETRIAWALVHHTWWPSVLLVLDSEAEIVGKFVNSGFITALNSLQTSAGPIVLAGGVSNANDAGMLAVLDGRRISGRSPEKPGSAYECKNCPEGQPLRYFVFPRSELNLVTGSLYNEVKSIGVHGNGFQVRTQEAVPGNFQETYWVESIYEFSPDLELKQAMHSDSYWDFHRRLELDGKVKHSPENCPERRQPKKVLAWAPETGWRELRLPLTILKR